MEKFETFTAYVRGELQPSDEESFFARMSYDAELRSDFRRFVAADNVLKKSASAFLPPNSVTNAIYTELGFSLPATAPAAAISGGSRTIFGSKIFLAGLSSIFSIAATILLLNVFTNKNNNDKNNFGITPVMANQQNGFLAENSSNIAANPELTGRRKNSHVQYPVKYITTNQSKFPEKELFEDFNKTEKIPASDIHGYLAENESKDLMQQNRLQTRLLLQQSNATEIQGDESGQENGISIGITSSINWNPVTENINTAHLSKLNNFGLFAEKNLTDDLALGIDLRQETFYLKYEGDENNVHYKYEQKPNLTTVGIIADYIIVRMADNDISIRGGAGANRYGYTGRLSLNFNYMYDPHIRFFAGAELNEFIFNYQSKSFSSQKFNLNFGLKYNF